MPIETIPVITVDGPAASGKGTVAAAVAAALAFHYLDSGKLYRAAALAAGKQQIDVDDNAGMVALLETLAADSDALTSCLQAPELICPSIGHKASQLAANARLRQRLLPLQRAMRQPPGLVADGRDMGSVVFPDARVRVFLTAALAVRAQRRYKQLQEQGINATMEVVCADISQRDEQDSSRSVAPLKCPVNALTIDSTQQSIDDIVQTILRAYHNAISLSPRTESQ